MTSHDTPPAIDSREPRIPPARADSADSDDTLVDVDLFGWDPDPGVGLLPLVDLWLDLDQHLSAEEIPDPSELQREADMMIM